MALNTRIRGAQIVLADEVIAVASDKIAFIDADGVMKQESVADLATAMAGSGLTATNGVLSTDAVADNIVEADIKIENLSADIDVTGYAGVHTLTNIPVTNSVQVFLNGLLQEEGSGKDYELGGTGNKTITFATAPVTGDIIIVHYILND